MIFKPVELFLLKMGLDNTRGGLDFLESKERVCAKLRLTEAESESVVPEERNGSLFLGNPDAPISREFSAGELETLLAAFHPRTGCQAWPGGSSEIILGLRDRLANALSEARAQETWDRLPEDLKKRVGDSA